MQERFFFVLRTFLFNDILYLFNVCSYVFDDTNDDFLAFSFCHHLRSLHIAFHLFVIV